MLKKLILENWKSFRYAELPLDPLTVLIGTNASGKSNVVEALEFLQRIANGENIETALAGDKTLPAIRGGVEWAARKGENEFILTIIIEGEYKNQDHTYRIKIQTNPALNILLECIDTNTYEPDNQDIINFNYTLQAESSERKQHKNNEQKISEYIEGEPYDVIAFTKGFKSSSLLLFNENNEPKFQRPHSVVNIVFLSLKNILTFNPIPSTMRNYSRLSENLESDASNIAGVLAALPEDKKAEVENTLSEYIKYLPEGDIKKVWSEPVGRLKTDAMLYCQEEWKPGEITEIDARSMSDGTLRFLAILTALLTRPEGSQIVIEEIDNGLHPSRAALLVKILKEIGSKRNIDILLTTHNPALLDAFGSEIVPFVVVAHRDSETGESKLTLLEDIENFPKLFASYSLGQMTTKGAIERSLSHGA
ncbi:AAA family ATPase [Sphaerospermopsis sp. LEGE 00249]|uniref:AAA family ATPase n=1 Tax=Sphaerospermopsis sp. LEGE 00249 TaxID=1380707 RepID=UPI00164E31F7|nr:ATP-binding protein [Sphaerospermopsis sp. LEGE 00249]MBC5796038.1 AAA family ATPase [Sphaerospermopsis sp. LEGE 00249]